MCWVPAGTNKPAIIYCPGHGWTGRHPDAFYSPDYGDPLFLERIEPNYATKPVAVFSLWAASKAYNLRDNRQVKAPTWTSGTAYSLKNLTQLSGQVYRCIEAHTSGASTQPGVGASWQTRWYAVPVSEIGDAQQFDVYAKTPGYLASNVFDLQAAYSHVVANATTYGVDRGRIIVMGASAGGQQAGSMAYDLGGAFSTLFRPPVGSPYAANQPQKPQAVILRITPDDWRNYPWDVLMQGLFGENMGSGPWAAFPDFRKASLSPLGVLKSTRSSIPTFLAYGNFGTYDGAIDDPPYPTAEYHNAKNGWQIFKFLVGTLVQPNCVFVEDHPTLASTFRVWTSAGGTGSAHHNIAGDVSTEALEIWNWIVSLFTL